MKERNFEYYELIGFVLFSVILLFFMYPDQSFQQAPQEQQGKKAEQLVEKGSLEQTPLSKKNETVTFLNEGIEGENILENGVLRVKISNKGGQISEVFLKKHKAYDHNTPKHRRDLYLIKDNSFSFGLTFQTLKGEKADTRRLYFTPEFKEGPDALQLIMRTYLSEGQYIEYVYALKKKGDYDVDFSIRTRGLNDFTQGRVGLNWEQQALSFEKGRNWEGNYTQLYYSYDKHSRVKYLSESGDDREQVENVDWVANKQQFFTSILSSNMPLKNVDVQSSGLTSQHALKSFRMQSILDTKGGEANFSGQWYFGLLDYDLLKKYNQNFEDMIPFGWGILRWINTYFFLVIFQFLSKTELNYGIIIILMTIVVKLILSPITYRQYKLSAMMKVIRREIEDLNEKHKKADPLKRQQAMMELYRKTGVNPMSGCLPALFQIPIFYALFRFFPTIIDLRGQTFLWTDDLTSYDSIFQLPFSIPIYGEHVSLFTLLYTAALLLYTRVSGNNNNMSTTQQVMPDMRFMMYLMPFIMLLFINGYASGLSLYYFVSNMLNIALIFIIKKFILDEEKIHKKIQENKAKPKKQGGWQERMRNLVEEAQKQQVAQKVRKK
ncbi:MAG: membrane protein insertase YidC [Flavobacteriales bacterium Tduv]